MYTKSLSPLQNSILMYQTERPYDSSYNLSYLWKLSGSIDVDRLYLSFKKVLNKHDVYHANIKDGKNYFDDNREFKPQIINIEDQNFTESVMNDVKNKTNIPINLETWPLQNVTIYVSSLNNNTSYLFLNFSHIICDAYTAFEVFHEVSNQYNGIKTNEELVKQYNNSNALMGYSTNNSKLKDSEAIRYYSKLIEKYKVNTMNIEELSDNGGINSYCDKEYTFDDNLKDICNYFDCSKFELLLSVYAVLVNKLFSKKIVSIGIPIANRRSEDRRTHGLFVNTLPSFFYIDDSCSFKDIVNQAKSSMYNILHFQNFNFAYHVSDIFGYNSKSVRPLNVLFTYYKYPLMFQLNNVTVEKVNIPTKYSMSDLSFALESLNNGKYCIHVNTKLNASSLYDAYIYIFQQIKKDKDIIIKNINLLSEDYEQQLLLLQNQSDEIHNMDVIESFNKIVHKFPKNIAIRDKESSLSYDELNGLSKNIANLLLEQDKTQIVVTLKPSINLIAIILGILKAGLTYVPLDKSMPTQRKEDILSQLDNYLIISDYDSNIFNDKEIIKSSEFIQKAKNYYKNKSQKAMTNNPAYYIFTSGSTGIPKGVIISRKAISSLFSTFMSDFNLLPNLNWILFHSYGFDYSIFEIFGAMTSGGTLNIVPSQIKKFPDEFWNFIYNNHINVLTQTPSSFISLQRFDSSTNKKLSDLKYVFIGGEDIKFIELQQWFSKYGYDVPKVYNLYGVTEGTIISTYHLINKEDVDNHYVNNIGKSLSSVNSRVVSEHMNNILPGMIGELVISGDSIADGYYKNNEQTKSHFKRYCSGIFYTGDLVKLLPNGEYQYLNRIDKQVQISGHRVEIGEIENTMSQISEIKFSFVISHKFSTSDNRLIGYYTSDKNISIRKIQEFMKENLPEYMIPSFFIKLNDIPENINGKVDLSNLPLPKLNTLTNTTNSNNTIQKVISIWENILGTHNIQPDSTFFDVGGTSVLISEVYYNILKLFDITDNEMSMIDLFQYTTPKDVADYIDNILRKR